jgi:hypothetical protein
MEKCGASRTKFICLEGVLLLEDTTVLRALGERLLVATVNLALRARLASEDAFVLTSSLILLGPTKEWHMLMWV